MKSTAAPTYPVASIAKLLLSDRRVQQLTKEGVIPKAERGRYELALAVQGYIRFLQERSLRSDSSPIDYHMEKARLTKDQADSSEIEAAKARQDVVGLIAKSDNDRGFWWSPSNQNINGIVGTVRPVDFTLGDANARANLLNEGGIATIIRQDGYRLWGNRTLSSGPKWMFLSVRRTADMINDSLLRAHLWAVDRNITKTYMQDVIEGVNAYLRHLTAISAILGGKCWADPEDRGTGLADVINYLDDNAGAALRVVDSGNQLQTAALQSSSIVGRNPVTAVALSSAQTLGNKAGSLQMMASSSGRLLRESTSNLESLANVSAATIQSVRVAAACAEKTATLCRQTAGEAAKITGVATA